MCLDSIFQIWSVTRTISAYNCTSRFDRKAANIPCACFIATDAVKWVVEFGFQKTFRVSKLTKDEGDI